MAERVELGEDGILVEADLLGRLLAIEPAEVPRLLREKAIAMRCERGEGRDEGQYRLTFRYRSRRARLVIDGRGQVLQRQVVTIGVRPSRRVNSGDFA